MYKKPVMTDAEYQDLSRRYKEYHNRLALYCAHPNVVTKEESELLPESISNEDISRMEVYEFIHDIPERYFAYVHEYEARIKALNGQEVVRKYPDFITTWTGEELGKITEAGRVYRSNMEDERINIRVKAINGREYSGIYFRSSGDYCRLKICKAL